MTPSHSSSLTRRDLLTAGAGVAAATAIFAAPRWLPVVSAQVLDTSALGVIGLWLILANGLAFRTRLFNRILAALGFLTGLGWLLAAVVGILVGKAVVLTQRSRVVRFGIVPGRVDDELAAIDRARERSRAQLQDIRAQVARLRGHELAALFDAQLLILDDPLFLGRARDIVRDERVNAAWAVHRAYEELCEVFATVEPFTRAGTGRASRAAATDTPRTPRRPG